MDGVGLRYRIQIKFLWRRALIRFRLRPEAAAGNINISLFRHFEFKGATSRPRPFFLPFFLSLAFTNGHSLYMTCSGQGEREFQTQDQHLIKFHFTESFVRWSSFLGCQLSSFDRFSFSQSDSGGPIIKWPKHRPNTLSVLEVFQTRLVTFKQNAIYSKMLRVPSSFHSRLISNEPQGDKSCCCCGRGAGDQSICIAICCQQPPQNNILGAEEVEAFAAELCLCRHLLLFGCLSKYIPRSDKIPTTGPHMW